MKQKKIILVTISTVVIILLISIFIFIFYIKPNNKKVESPVIVQKSFDIKEAEGILFPVQPIRNSYFPMHYRDYYYRNNSVSADNIPNVLKVSLAYEALRSKYTKDSPITVSDFDVFYKKMFGNGATYQIERESCMGIKLDETGANIVNSNCSATEKPIYHSVIDKAEVTEDKKTLTIIENVVFNKYSYPEESNKCSSFLPENNTSSFCEIVDVYADIDNTTILSKKVAYAGLDILGYYNQGKEELKLKGTNYKYTFELMNDSYVFVRVEKI